ncbi:hypothetical protein ABH926_006138 [Catenulispora sp. GP43]|uniref:hypothetical protein n=1 Tax=Catenulispora sp. GP43 TaxID=3156263 RepID=UPI003519078E
MTSRPSRRIATAARLAAAAVLTATSVAAAMETPATAAGATAYALPASLAGLASPVTLPTGEQFDLNAHGTITPLNPDPHADLTGFDDPRGDHYLIPSEAMPYAGHQLDLSLFDLTKLATAQAAQGSGPGRIPVRLSYQSGVTPTAPAGITLTSTSGASATGYFTPESGKALAAALRQRLAADVAAGRSPGASGLPSGLSSMALAGTTTPASSMAPDSRMRVLQINAIDGSGLPANLPILLENTDNSQISSVVAPVVDGVARIAVPAGNYAAFGEFYQVDANGFPTKDSLVTLQDFQVPATGDVPVRTLDARTATSQVNVTTDLPSTPTAFVDFAVRTPAVGRSFTIYQFEAPPTVMAVTPAAKAAVGQFSFQTRWNSAGPATGPQYQYNAYFTSDHVDADQSHTAHAADMAKVSDTLAGEPAYGSEPRRVESAPQIPGQDAFGILIGSTFANGTTGTGYYTPGRWARGVVGPPEDAEGHPIDRSFAQVDPVQLSHGDHEKHVWTQGPSTPGVRRHDSEDAVTYCGACVGGGGLNLSLSDIGDSNEDTSGQQTGNVQSAYYWNGRPVTSPAGFPSQLGLVLATVPTGPATVRAVIDVNRAPQGATQSTQSHTDVSFPYTGQTDPGATLPASDECLAAEIAGHPTAACQILPVLTVTYRLAGLSTMNTTTKPVQTLALDIGHEHFGKFGPRAAVTCAQVSVSTDGGTTWYDAPTVGADGHYVAFWHNPAAGTSITLRVTAKDAVGGTITQTVTNPYTVG